MAENINIRLEETESVVCEECGEPFFEHGLVLRKVSGILSGTGQPSYIPIPVFTCKKCGHVNTEFLPRELKDL